MHRTFVHLNFQGFTISTKAPSSATTSLRSSSISSSSSSSSSSSFFLSSEIKEREIMSNLNHPRRIMHFSHPHHLLELTKCDQVRPTSLCAVCKRSPTAPVSATIPAASHIYSCPECDYFLHMPCSTLPKLVSHRPSLPDNKANYSSMAASGSANDNDKTLKESKRRRKWMKRLKYTSLCIALVRLACGDPTSPVELSSHLFGVFYSLRSVAKIKRNSS